MQTEKAVEVDRGAVTTLTRPWNRDRGPNPVVILFSERQDDIQPVSGASQEEHDELFLVRHGSGRHRTLEKRGNRAHADHRYAAALHKNAPRNFHVFLPYTRYIKAIAVGTQASRARALQSSR